MFNKYFWVFVFGTFVSWGFCLLGVLSLGFLSMELLSVGLLSLGLPSGIPSAERACVDVSMNRVTGNPLFDELCLHQCDGVGMCNMFEIACAISKWKHYSVSTNCELNIYDATS